MSDLLIVGAGIVGSCAAAYARSRGLTVEIVAGADPAHSDAAAALLRPSYLPKERRGDLAVALGQYGRELYDGWVTSYQRPGAEPVLQPGWALISPPHQLLAPDRVEILEEIPDHPRVLLATGAHTALPRPEGTITWGVTWVGQPSALVCPDRLRLHHYAPYKTISAGAVGGLARVGSSSGRTPEDAMARGVTMLEKAFAVGLVHPGADLRPLLGARLKTAENVVQISPGVVWAGGHHRNGFALAPADSRRAVDLLLEKS